MRIQYIPNRVIDRNGISDGAELFVYQSGTTTKVPLFSDEGLTQPITNPLVTVVGAEVPVFYTSFTGEIRLRIIDRRGNVAMDEDPYSAPATTSEVGEVRDGLVEQVNITAGVISVLNEGGAGDGVTNDSAAAQRAVNALPPEGGTVIFPDGRNWLLDQPIVTGAKKVHFVLGAGTYTCPRGDFALKLQSNGSSIRGAGRWATIFKLRSPVNPVVFPTVTLTRTAGSITAATASGGSGIVTTPVVLIGNSPAPNNLANDAATVAYVSGGTITSLMPGGVMSAQGADYTSNPDVNFLAGGAGAVLIDNVQSTSVCDFSIDFQNIPNSTGVVHLGGWWAEISRLNAIYNVATGAPSEHSSSVGLLVDSYTLGSPGTTGGYGGVYVCRYNDLYFSKRFIVGHDTSTATTLRFDTCDFKNSYIHAAVGVVDINPVNQGDTGDFYNLVNIDALTIVAGDFEGASQWFHTYGSCNNLKCYNTLSYNASGPKLRGRVGTGWYLDFARSNESDFKYAFPLRTGSLSAGAAYRNTGFSSSHRVGITYDGNVFINGASNAWPISGTELYLDDPTQAGIYTFSSTSGQFGGRMAYTNAGATQVTSFRLWTFSDGGLTLGAGMSYKINDVKVLGSQEPAIPNIASAPTAADYNKLLTVMRNHGIIAT